MGISREDIVKTIGGDILTGVENGAFFNDSDGAPRRFSHPSQVKNAKVLSSKSSKKCQSSQKISIFKEGP